MGDQYEQLLAVLRMGGRLPQSAIDATLVAAGRTYRDLTADLHVGPVSSVPTECEVCGEPLGVTSSKRRGSVCVQYLRCPICGWRPDPCRRTVPGVTVPRRRRRQRTC